MYLNERNFDFNHEKKTVLNEQDGLQILIKIYFLIINLEE